MKSQTATEPTHDPKARAVAKAVYDALNPRSVILFGSRARGDFRRDSDIDLLIITDGERGGNDRHGAARNAAYAKSAEVYGARNRLGVDFLYMSEDKFRHCRRAKNHVAGQAARDGVDMNGEPVPPDDQPPDNSLDIIPKIAVAKRNLSDLSIGIEVPESSQEMIGFLSREAVVNAMKGWISALDDEYRNIRSIAELAAIIRNHPEEESSRAGERLRRLADCVVEYQHRDEPAGIRMDDRHELFRVVSETVSAIMERIEILTNTEEGAG